MSRADSPSVTAHSLQRPLRGAPASTFVGRDAEMHRLARQLRPRATGHAAVPLRLRRPRQRQDDARRGIRPPRLQTRDCPGRPLLRAVRHQRAVHAGVGSDRTARRRSVAPPVLDALLSRHAAASPSARTTHRTVTAAAAQHRSRGPRPNDCSARWPTASKPWPPSTPLVLLLEDVHWADYSTLDLLSALARAAVAGAG